MGCLRSPGCSFEQYKREFYLRGWVLFFSRPTNPLQSPGLSFCSTNKTPSTNSGPLTNLFKPCVPITSLCGMPSNHSPKTAANNLISAEPPSKTRVLDVSSSPGDPPKKHYLTFVVTSKPNPSKSSPIKPMAGITKFSRSSPLHYPVSLVNSYTNTSLKKRRRTSKIVNSAEAQVRSLFSYKRLPKKLINPIRGR